MKENRNKREFVESGFKVTLTKKESFRFAENPGYQKLSGSHLKEMDFGWWDPRKKRIFLLELKGKEIWTHFEDSQDKASEELVKMVSGKSTDVLLMFAAVWSKTGQGEKIKKKLPVKTHRYPGENKLKLIFLIDFPPPQRELLLSLSERINRELLGRMRLFGSERITLVDFETARKIKLPVKRLGN